MPFNCSIAVCNAIRQRKHASIMNDCFLLDRSGKISRAELKRVLNALNIKASERELQDLMKQMDTDNSGEIDFNEFKIVMGATFFKKHTRSELLGAFKKFDTDNNGYITVDELNEILARLGQPVSRTAVESMIKSLDKTGDGRLSFEEFCTLFD
jgi:Ca2+-binding EF-hand superfamily protein